MRYLLDTNVIVMAFENNPRLERKSFDVLNDAAHEIYCSIASVWEMSIKSAIGKLKVPDNLLELLAANNIKLLPISVEHAYAIRSLPRLHGDPFDRMLVAQAMLEDMILMTHDKQLLSYSVSCMMV